MDLPLGTKPLIKSMVLKSGRTPGMPEQQFSPASLTVFVGPNSSGKSMALRELHLQVAHWQMTYDPKIVDKLRFEPLNEAEIDYAIKRFRRLSTPQDNLRPNAFMYSQRNAFGPQTRDELKVWLTNPDGQAQQFRNYYGNNVTLYLEADKRAALTANKNFGDLQRPDPFNSYQMLSVNDELRYKVRDILYRVFGKYLVLDPTTSQVRLAFTKRAPVGSFEEQGFHKEARDFYATAEHLESFSTGVNAYVGLIVEVAASDARVIIIDEPEAFLHPPLAQQLGTEIANLASGNNAQVFAATHSAHFVMGCLHSNVSAEIVRLTYQDGVATARILSRNNLLTLMRNPLLRSTGVINALFYEYVIITESDSDRAFYQEINERLTRSGRGIPNCLFLNAQNKQTTRILSKPLRELGIPSAVIVDIDILKEGGSVWSDFLEAAGIPPVDRRALATAREAIHSIVKSGAIDIKRGGGVVALSGSDRESATNLFSRLHEYGCFVVPGGELESWLAHLGVKGHGPSWLIEMFERMGEDGTSNAYVHPAESDVWLFLDQVAAWLRNPDRKGMPS